MRTRTTSALGAAALVLVIVGLALWVVSQLTGSGAAAESLPVLVVGGDAASAESGSAEGSLPGVVTTAPGALPSTTQVTSSGSAGPAATGTTKPAASPQGTTVPVTTRTVVPDPVREHVQDHAGSGSPGGTPMGGGSPGSTSGAEGASGSGMMGH